MDDKEFQDIIINGLDLIARRIERRYPRSALESRKISLEGKLRKAKEKLAKGRCTKYSDQLPKLALEAEEILNSIITDLEEER